MSVAASPLNGRRILLVEDEYMIAEIMEEWLHQAGGEVVGPVAQRGASLGVPERKECAGWSRAGREPQPR
jgi:CheY-like chemotaxis protein